MRRFERGDQKQLRIGEVRVEEIPFDPKSRDDIPAILRGLKALYCDGESRDRLFELLERHLGEKRDCDLSRGRRGMELWSMVVLALLKEGLNCDFDRLHHMANHDALIRLMLVHTSLDAEAYHRQTLIDNVSLVTPQLIGEISRLVVGLGHEVVRKKPGAALSGRVDSFVVETDVAHPTDVRLLWDACRSALRLSRRWSNDLGVQGWRQEGHWQRTLRAHFGKIRRARDAHRRPEDVEAYLALCSQLLIRLEEWHARHSAKLPISVRERLEERLAMGVTLLDQVRERLLEGQQIPAQEKIYSVFEPHTRWISKGKAGFARTVALSILAANIHRLGKLLLAKDHQRQRRKRRTQLEAA